MTTQTDPTARAWGASGDEPSEPEPVAPEDVSAIDAPMSEPTLLDRLAKVPDTFRTDRLTAAVHIATARADLHQEVTSARELADEGLTRAIETRDVQGAVEAAQRLVAVDVVAERLPCASLDDVDDGAARAAFDMAAARLSATSSIPPPNPLAYQRDVAAFRDIVRQGFTGALPPVCLPGEQETDAVRDNLLCRIAALQGDASALIAERDRLGADLFSLLGAAADLIKRGEEMRTAVDELNLAIAERNEHRARAGVQPYKPFPESG